MINLRVIFVTIAALALLEAAMAGPTKIAYKKPIYGKVNLIKEQHLKAKAEVHKATIAITTTTPTTTTTTESSAGQDAPILPQTTLIPPIAIQSEGLEDSSVEEIVREVPEIIEDKTELPLDESVTDPADTTLGEEDFEVAVAEVTTQAPPPSKASDDPHATVPCTCGVFLTSQLKRGGAGEPPHGKPVIMNELDRPFPCTAVGQKQCQTKCLETIVQHLPNSANILCATIDRDIRKERAYLFIKNCRNQWWNTNLAAGREYCCQNGQPYTCPMV